MRLGILSAQARLTESHLAYCKIVLKIVKGALNEFSTDNSAMNSHFEAHLLLLDKDAEFLISLNNILFK